MDAHYTQVMNAREAAAATGTRLYFGYSTVLDRAAFEEWRAQHAYEFFSLPEGKVAEAVDVSLAYDFPSRWWGGRVAGIVDGAGKSVWGRVFEIANKDWPIISHKEGGVTGMSVERVVRVRIDGKEVEATAFATNPSRASFDGPVSTRFLDALERGARAAALPEPWVSSLRPSAS